MGYRVMSESEVRRMGQDNIQGQRSLLERGLNAMDAGTWKLVEIYVSPTAGPQFVFYSSGL